LHKHKEFPASYKSFDFVATKKELNLKNINASFCLGYKNFRNLSGDIYMKTN